MTKLSLVVCKIIDHSSEDVSSRPFGQVSEIGGILPFPVDVNTRVKVETVAFSVMQRNLKPC